jgi:hypothetical protein
MSRNRGLLAAGGAALSALLTLVHGDLVPIAIAGASASTGLAAYLAIPRENAVDDLKKEVRAETLLKFSRCY